MASEIVFGLANLVAKKDMRIAFAVSRIILLYRLDYE